MSLPNIPTTLEDEIYWSLNYGFIGLGKIGQAMAESLIWAFRSLQLKNACGVNPTPNNQPIQRKLPPIYASFHSQGKADLYHAQHNEIRVTTNNAEVATNSDVLFICCKPQNFSEIAEEIKDSIQHQTIIISIMAGMPIDKLDSYFPDNHIIRAMPNICVQTASGITVWTDSYSSHPPKKRIEENKKVVHTVMETFGTSIYVQDERYLDMATALSGSGPAYVFLFMECLVDAAVKLGLPRDLAYQLSESLLSGSSQFIVDRGNEGLPQLRYKVTSPGGTTAAAIHEAEKGGLRTIISNMIEAAYLRSQELSKF